MKKFFVLPVAVLLGALSLSSCSESNDDDNNTTNGFDIVKISSKPNKYFWGSREFQVPELKLLLDAVSSSRFITRKKSADLKRKITGLASVHQRKQVSRHIYTTSIIKPRNENIYYIVDANNDAVENNTNTDEDNVEEVV